MLDGFRMIIEDSIIKGEKVYDNDFSFAEMMKGSDKFVNLDYGSVEWFRLSELMSPSIVQFFPDVRVFFPFIKYLYFSFE